MLLNQRTARVARGVSLGAVALGAAAAVAAQMHPAAAGALFATMSSVITCANNSACITGANTQTGIGVYGTSATGTAVSGRSQNGDGIDGLSYNVINTYGVGVKGTTANGLGFGMFGIAANGVGVAGLAANGIGVYGNSTGASGVGVLANNEYGSTALQATTIKYGIAVDAVSPSGIGIYSASNSGLGAFLSSSSSIGLEATNNGGVHTPTVDATNYGLGYGGHFSGGYGGVWGEAPDYPLVATDQHENTVFDVDGSGDISYTGSLYAYSRLTDGTKIAAYSAKTTSPTVEDTGTAQLAAGNATVRLDPTFARTIDLTASYRVFVTANGDTHGLFVASKTPSGFVVHENQNGRSTVSFDYRIVATALGHTGQRMSVANAAATMPVAPKLRVAVPAAATRALPQLPPNPAY
jgi:hypothetical protein